MECQKTGEAPPWTNAIGVLTCAGLLAASMLLCPAPALAQDAAMLRAERHLDTLADLKSRGNSLPGSLLDSLTEIHFRGDVDGSGSVTAEDELLLERVARNKRRSAHFSYWAQHDLDGDGVVTLDEVRLTYWHEARVARNTEGAPDFHTPEAIEARLQAKLATRLEGLHDADGDGIFTWEEALAGAEADIPLSRDGIAADYERTGRGFGPRFNVTSDFDADGDGGVTLEEFLAPYRALLDRYDADGDGLLSEAEHAPLKDAAKANSAAARALGPGTWLD